MECEGGVVLKPYLVVLSPAIPILGMDVLSGHKCAVTFSRQRPGMQILRPLIRGPVTLIRPLFVECTIKGPRDKFRVNAMIDSGASCCFMSQDMAREHNLKVENMTTTRRCHTITGTTDVVGYSTVEMKFLGHSTSVRLCVKENQDEVIIGLDVLLDLELKLKF